MNILKLNPVRLAFIILFLIIIDVAVLSWEKQLLVEPSQARLLTQEISSVRALKSHMKQSNGYNVIFVGDSTTYGRSSKARETIPFYFEQELRHRFPDKKINVFNCAYNGFTFMENYFMLTYLSDLDIDLIIYGIPYFRFYDQDLPSSYTPPILSTSASYDEINKLGVTVVNPETDQASLLIAQYWALYRNKSDITAALLGGSLTEKLQTLNNYFYDPIAYQKTQLINQYRYHPWFKSKFPPLEKIKTININANNPQVKVYKLLLNRMQDTGVPAVLYASPINFAMLESYGLGIVKESDIDKIRSISEPGINIFLDYSQAVPNKYFQDTIHLLAPGNKIVAEKLSHEIIKRNLLQ